MIVNATVTTPCAPVKADYVSVRRSDLERIARSYDAAWRTWLEAVRESREPSALAEMAGAMADAFGGLSACIAAMRDTADIRETDIFDPDPPAEISVFEPAPEDEQWAAESLAPTAPPRTTIELRALVSDALESVGLEPTGGPTWPIDFRFQGHDYALDLVDLAQFFEHAGRRRESEHAAGGYGWE